MSTTPIFERTWLATSPQGDQQNLVLQVFMPIQQADGSWTCEVRIGSIAPAPPPIRGADSWQAVQLAVKFLAMNIRSLEQEGWQFFWQWGDRTHAEDLGWHAKSW